MILDHLQTDELVYTIANDFVSVSGTQYITSASHSFRRSQRTNNLFFITSASHHVILRGIELCESRMITKHTNRKSS